jgi:uncharacterized membrane protein
MLFSGKVRAVPAIVRAFVVRPLLTSAFGVGLLTGLLLVLFAVALSWSTSAILAWDATSAWFIGGSLLRMSGRDVPSMRAYAASEDEGQGIILGIMLLAVIASLGAIGADLSAARTMHGFAKTGSIALAFGTVAISWFMMQLTFALHYAHEYYGPTDDPRGKLLQQGGLDFPGGLDPDYWDFLHFAIVIGVAAQTADIAFTSKALRRIGTLQSVVAFVFNTVVLALTINLLASLFGSGQ